MKRKIEDLLKDSLVLAEKKFKEDKTAQQFEKSKNEFRELINKGLANERGNNLLSLSDEKSMSKIVFNTKIG